MSDLKRNALLISKKFTEYFLPTVLTVLANNLAIVVDSVIVGHMLGSNSMSAINVLSPVSQFYFAMTLLFGLGSATLIAYAKGKEDSGSADRYFTVGFISIVVLSAVLMTLQFMFFDSIVSALTSVEVLKNELELYYLPYVVGTPLSLLLPSAVHCIRGDGRPKFASSLIIIANLINLTMDVVLMGIFKTGIIGSSIATVIGNAVAFLIMLSYFRSESRMLHFDFSVLKDIKKLFKDFMSLLKTGLAGALGALLVTVRIFYLNGVIQKNAGAEGMMAMSVISMCQIFVSAFIAGASQSMIPLVGVLMGEGDVQGVKYAFNKTVKTLVAAIIAIVAVIELFPGAVARMFGEKTPQELLTVIPALRISAVAFLGMSLAYMMIYYCTATKRERMATVISVVDGIVVILPLAFVLTKQFGISGAWAALAISPYVTLAITFFMFFVKKKHSAGKYRDLYLLDKDQENELISFSITSNDTVPDINEHLKDGLISVDEKKRADICCAVCDIMQTVKKPKYKRMMFTDVRITQDGDVYLLTALNNGVRLSTKDFKGEYKKCACTQVLGMNQINISI